LQIDQCINRSHRQSYNRVPSLSKVDNRRLIGYSAYHTTTAALSAGLAAAAAVVVQRLLVLLDAACYNRTRLLPCLQWSLMSREEEGERGEAIEVRRETDHIERECCGGVRVCVPTSVCWVDTEQLQHMRASVEAVPSYRVIVIITRMN
jgi:hypothetical protein